MSDIQNEIIEFKTEVITVDDEFDVSNSNNIQSGIYFFEAQPSDAATHNKEQKSKY